MRNDYPRAKLYLPPSRPKVKRQIPTDRHRMTNGKDKPSSRNFNRITAADIAHFNTICGLDHVLTTADLTENYAHDETENLRYYPEVVLRPGSTDEVVAVMRHCHQADIPITPCGARTGLSGGALCVHGGVALSTERLNKILLIDEDNLQVVTQPGVITQVLQETVAECGLFYPVDPASRGSCFIGGNVSENSGGPRAVKYGVTKDFVLNLEVVLPSGHVIRTGANTLKNATGYSLTQLMVGSEGTLGIITEITLRLLPHPKTNVLLLAPFDSAEKACEAVAAIFKLGITPSAMEFMERDAIRLAEAYTDTRAFASDIMAEALLLIELDGNREESLHDEAAQIADLLENFGCREILFADSHEQKEKLWHLRRKVGEAVKHASVYKEEDTVVPRFRLPQLLSGTKAICQRHGIRSVCYGHAGDGNLHINLLKDTMEDDQWETTARAAIIEIFQLTVSLGGTLSGEHGIGWVQRDFMPLAFSQIELNLMQRIKSAFDPTGILNPGKIFPPENQ